MVRLEEPIERGQVVKSFVVTGTSADGQTSEIVRGTTIGHARLERFAPRRVTQLTVSIDCIGGGSPMP